MSEPIIIALIGAATPILIAMIPTIASIFTRRMEKPGILVPQGYEERKIEKRIIRLNWQWLIILVIICGLLGYFIGVVRQKNQHPSYSPTADNQIPAQAIDVATETQEQSSHEIPTAWTEIQTVVSNITPTFDPTKTTQPTALPTTNLPPVIPTSTSIIAIQPPRIDPPTVTNIPPTSTDIPPSNTPPPTAIKTPLLSFDSLPSAQGWIYLTGSTGIPDTSVFYVGGGQLHMNTMGRGDSGFAYILYTPIDSQLPFTLVVRARVTDYGDQTNENPWGFSICVYVGLEQFAIGISPGRIIDGTDNLSPSAIDVHEFHDYRIEGQAGQNFRVFVDNILLGNVAPVIVSNPQNALYFGDATAGANAQVDIVSFSFTQ